MKLVIDTNRIMAGLLKDSTSRKIILHESFSFFASDYIEAELKKTPAVPYEKDKNPRTGF
jgi:predicted nucleic acid-binding protein